MTDTSNLSSTPTFHTGDVTRAHTHKIAELFSAAGDPRSTELFAWHYQQNPEPDFFARGAYVGGELGALYATLQLPVWRNGRVTHGLQSFDTLTGPALRGKGLFVSLAKETYARASAENQDVVFGFPNAASQKGFFGPLGWTRYGPAPFLIRPLSTKFLSTRWLDPKLGFSLPGVRVPTLPAFRVEAGSLAEVVQADLWSEVRTNVPCAVDRNPAYLTWRLGRPDAHYQTVVLRSGNAVRGYAVYRVVDKHDTRVGYLMDVLYPPNDTLSGIALVAGALRAMQRDGARVALAWCLGHSFNAAAHWANGFFPLPERMRPIELHFGARGLAGATPSITDWYISYLDSDTV